MPAFINIGQRLEGVGESEELKAFTTAGFFGSEFGPMNLPIPEEAARAAMPAGRLLIIRTSFRARQWPHPVAFSDLFTSQDYVDVLAPHIALAIAKTADIPHDTLHIAGRRRSALELARERRPDVQAATRASASVELPADISLNTDRWQQLLQRFAA